MKVKIAKQEVELSNIQVPDLWEISQLEELKGYSLGGKPAGKLIVETWHLAHDLLNALREIETQRNAINQQAEIRQQVTT